MFSPQLHSKETHVRDFSKRKKGFGMADRFLYVKMARRLATCQDNVGPAEYDPHVQFKNLTQLPCNTVIVRSAPLAQTLQHLEKT